jgi:uncharacterized protein YbjT (DUF2867 family)
MENLPSPMFVQGDKLLVAMKPDTKLQMIAVDDIGRFGAAAFQKAEEWKRAEIDISGDAVTMTEAAQLLSEGLGRKITFEELPIAAVRGFSEDMALMLEWFETTGYSVDIPSLESKWAIRPKSAAEWAHSLRG